MAVGPSRVHHGFTSQELSISRLLGSVSSNGLFLDTFEMVNGLYLYSAFLVFPTTRSAFTSAFSPSTPMHTLATMQAATCPPGLSNTQCLAHGHIDMQPSDWRTTRLSTEPQSPTVDIGWDVKNKVIWITFFPDWSRILSLSLLSDTFTHIWNLSSAFNPFLCYWEQWAAERRPGSS